MQVIIKAIKTNVKKVIRLLFLGTSLAHSFCNGRSLTMEHVLAESSGIPLGNIHFGMKLLLFGVSIGPVFFIAEISCYCAIYYKLFKHYTLNFANLPMKIIAKRKHKNVVTLSGQIINFVIENALNVIVQIMLFSNEPEIVEPSFFPIYVSIGYTAITISYYFTSQELKDYYNISTPILSIMNYIDNDPANILLFF